MKIYSRRVVLPNAQGGVRVQPACIEVRGDRIIAVQTQGDPFDKELTPDVQHLGDHVVTAALVNAHTHLALSSFRGLGQTDRMRGNVVEEFYYAMESRMDAGDAKAFTRMGAYESLLAGVGTVWDHYYHALEVAEGIADVGLTAVVAPTLQDRGGPGVSQLEAQLLATQTLATSTTWAELGITAAYGCHATDTVSDDLWRQVGELRRKHELPIHAHLAQSLEESERSFDEHGCSPVERLDRLGVLGGPTAFLMVHGLFVSAEDLDRLTPGREFLGHCPYAQAQFSYPAPIDAWLERSIDVVVGTDCGACNDTMNLQQELRLIAGGPGVGVAWSPALDKHLSTGGLDAARALNDARTAVYDRTAPVRQIGRLFDWITSAPGALHPHLKVGQIAPGFLANLVVWDFDHPATWPSPDPVRTLVMTNATAAIDQMMLRGQWMGEAGNFQSSILASDAYKDAQREANERLGHLLNRL